MAAGGAQVAREMEPKSSSVGHSSRAASGGTQRSAGGGVAGDEEDGGAEEDEGEDGIMDALSCFWSSEA